MNALKKKLATEAGVNLNYALKRASSVGNLSEVEKYLRLGANPRMGPGETESALEHAVSNGHYQIARLLLEHGADPNERAIRTSMLQHAYYARDKKMMRLLVEAGADVNGRTERLPPALIMAVQDNLPAFVELLMELGADPNVEDLEGRTAYFWGEKRPRIAAALKKGAPRKIEPGVKIDQFIRAAERGDLKGLKKLLEAGVAVDARDTIEGRQQTALMAAAAKGEVEAIRFLLKAGADLEATAMEGTRALLIAAENGHVGTLKALLEAGADVEARNQYGQRALMRAVACKKAKAVEALIVGGAKLDAVNLFDGAALHIAAREHDKRIIDILIGAGADVTALDKQKRTPLFHALFHAETVAHLLKKGSDASVRDENGLTCLQLSKRLPRGAKCAKILEAAPRMSSR